MLDEIAVARALGKRWGADPDHVALLRTLDDQSQQAWRELREIERALALLRRSANEPDDGPRDPEGSAGERAIEAPAH